MKKIKITLLNNGISAIAELREDKCPIVVKSLLSLLPIESKAFHAKWGGGEIWTQIPQFPEYAHENETCLPSIGEIIIMPQKDGMVAFDLWYDRGWCFGPTGFLSGAAIGMITEGLSQFASEAVKLSTEGAQMMRIESVSVDT
ncbi:MAG: DUF3830 family protein [Nitrososphaerota archaeon]|jgi:hypothetical protein|nr:DUF3830 family protein [Nitrososphaerota archaeon]